MSYGIYNFVRPSHVGRNLTYREWHINGVPVDGSETWLQPESNRYEPCGDDDGHWLDFELPSEAMQAKIIGESRLRWTVVMSCERCGEFRTWYLPKRDSYSLSEYSALELVYAWLRVEELRVDPRGIFLGFPWQGGRLPSPTPSGALRTRIGPFVYEVCPYVVGGLAGTAPLDYV